MLCSLLPAPHYTLSSSQLVMHHLAAIQLLLVSCAIFTTTLSSLSNALAVPKRRASSVCNGSSSFCNRSYGNITFAGSHDSYAIGDSIATNQNVSVTTQLESGIRMLQSQAHKSTNSTITGAGIDLCHTSCSLFQGGAIESWLSEIKNWSDSNPTEVVTLLIVNSDSLPASQFDSAFQSTGLSSSMYSPALATIPKTDWPTLGTLIDAKTPVVGFLTLEADHLSVPYLLDEFQNIWETPYDQTAYPFNCSIDRIGQGVTDSSSLMYISNQFLDSSYLDGSILVPNKDALGVTNSIQGTLSSSDTCASEHASFPNFILTDFSTVPDYDLMKAVAQVSPHCLCPRSAPCSLWSVQMNGVGYTAPTASSSSSSSLPSSSTSPSGSSSSSSSSSNNGVGTPFLHSYLAACLASTVLVALFL